MLKLRPSCEHCGKKLPPESGEAMICSFECTYCKTCAMDVFKNVCPGCTGNFVARPIRPKKYRVKYPGSQKEVFAPKNLIELTSLITEFEQIPPGER